MVAFVFDRILYGQVKYILFKKIHYALINSNIHTTEVWTL